MAKQKDRQEPHEFTKLTAFDAAVRKISGTPKEVVARREAAAKRKRGQKK
jgi:hypothetical protein